MGSGNRSGTRYDDFFGVRRSVQGQIRQGSEIGSERHHRVPAETVARFLWPKAIVQDIDWAHSVIVLRGEPTKSGKTREVPIGTIRLKAVPEWLRVDLDGKRKPDDRTSVQQRGRRTGQDVQTSILTTERYDNQKLEALQAAVARLESGKAFDPTRPMTGPKFQVCFKNGPRTGGSGGSESTGESPANALKKRRLDEWLAIRDEFRNWVMTAA